MRYDPSCEVKDNIGREKVIKALNNKFGDKIRLIPTDAMNVADLYATGYTENSYYGYSMEIKDRKCSSTKHRSSILIKDKYDRLRESTDNHLRFVNCYTDGHIYMWDIDNAKEKYDLVHDMLLQKCDFDPDYPKGRYDVYFLPMKDGMILQ